MCTLASKWSGQKLQSEGTIDHLVSSVRMKDGVQLLSSTAGENMKETSVTWSSRKKEKEKQKKKSSQWQMTRNPFSFLTSSPPRLLNHSRKYFPLRAVVWLSRDEQVFVRRRSGREEDAFAFLLLIANIQWQPTLFAVVFVGMRAHARCLSAWVDSKSSLY